MTGNSSIESLAYYRIPSHWGPTGNGADPGPNLVFCMPDPLLLSAEEAVPLSTMTVLRSSLSGSWSMSWSSLFSLSKLLVYPIAPYVQPGMALSD